MCQPGTCPTASGTGKLEVEPTPNAELTRHANFPSELLQNTAHDGQAQTVALSPDIAQALERREKLANLRRGQPGAVVLNPVSDVAIAGLSIATQVDDRRNALIWANRPYFTALLR